MTGFFIMSVGLFVLVATAILVGAFRGRRAPEKLPLHLDPEPRTHREPMVEIGSPPPTAAPRVELSMADAPPTNRERGS
jgi:hypothetical protein